MKATLVLLPLLGITYMLFFVNPGEDEVSRVVFIYFNSFLESFQVPPSFRSFASLAWRPDLHSWVGIVLAEAWDWGRQGWATWPGRTLFTSDSLLPFRASSCLCSTVF